MHLVPVEVDRTGLPCRIGRTVSGDPPALAEDVLEAGASLVDH
jgi:hypothetical protein